MEASPTLFSTQLGDSEAKLGLSGSWSTDLSGSLGFGFNSTGGGIYPTVFPGMTEGFNFQQIPNLDITLRLLDRYFFKTSFLDTTGSPTSSLPLGLNTFVLGYDGQPNEFLQSVRIGNSDVTMGTYDFLSFAAPSTSSLGASASFQSGNGSYQAMIRYEPAALHRRIFIGHDEISEQRVAPGSYVDGRFFVLPDDKVQNLTVYIEDDSGSYTDAEGHHYRIAGPDDVIISASDGTVAFREPLVGRALVYYTKNGLPVGSPGLGKAFLPATDPNTGALDLSRKAVDFNWAVTNYPKSGDAALSTTREVGINGRNTLLIYSPGQFSPFQTNGVYVLGSNLPAADTSVDATLIPNGTDGITEVEAGDGSQGAGAFLSLPGGQPLRVEVNTHDRTLTVLGYRQSGTQSPVDPRSLDARFPFGDFSSIYAAGPGRAPQDTGSQILVRMSTPVSAYQLDPNILKGSLRIIRNGHTETNYSVDYSSGLLTFDVPPADDDVIVVSYRTTETTKAGGDLLLGIGAAFQLLPQLKLDLGTGLRWAMFSGVYSTEEGTNTGSAVLSAGLHYNQGKNEGLRGSLEAGVSLSSPDTTGTFRLFGMEGDGTSISIAEGDLFPSSVPVTSEFTGIVGALPSLGFGQENRGELFYRDYHLYNTGGAVLEPIDWPLPDSQDYPYTDGSYVGPYPVADPSLGTVMVMDYRMTPSRDWVGAQIPLSGAPEDLSGAESLTFEVKSSTSNSNVAAYLQLGAVGEDLDDNGKLDGTTSAIDKSFPFDDNGTQLTTTGGASPKTGGTFSSEDTNLNELLDLENSSLVVTAAVSGFSTGVWKRISIQLSPADRKRLTHVDAARIVLVNKTNGTLLGTFQVSSLSISKSPFSVDQADSGASNLTVHEVVDPKPTGQRLEDLFPEVKNTFHAGGTPQKVLEVRWSGAAAAAPAWSLVGYPNPVAANVYKNLDFYLLGAAATSTSAPSFSLDFTNQIGVGAHVTLPIPIDDRWHKYSIDLTSGAVSIDGNRVAQKATIDAGASRYTRLTLSSTGASSGDFYIDEIHLSQATMELSAGTTLDTTYSNSGVVASVAGIPLLSDLTVNEQASATGPRFATGFESYPNRTAVASYTEAKGRLPFGSIGIHFGVSTDASQTAVSDGHDLRIPLGPLSVGDSYSQTVESGQMTFSRSNNADVSFGPALSANFQDSATALGPDLTQTIQAHAATHPPGRFTLSASGLVTNQLDQYSPPSLQYFPNWADSYRLLAPLDAVDAERSGSLQADGELSLGRTSGQTAVKLSLQPSASYQSTLTTGRIQSNVGGIRVSVPIASSAAGAGNLSITPSYSRDFSSSIGSLSNESFVADFATYADALSKARYLYDSLPFAELFSAKTATEFLHDTIGDPSATYEPGVSVTVARRTGSFLRDLFLPSQLLLSLTRTLSRESDTVTDALDWEVQYGTDALNLFGTAGVYPLFTFYKTEEIATNLQVTHGLDESSAVIQNLITLYFSHNNELQLDHRLDLTWATSFQATDHVTLSFSYRPHARLTLPLVPQELQRGSYLENTESATIASIPDAVANGLQVNLDHETAMVLPDHGKISASAGFGVSENRISSGGRRILFGVQATVGAQLAF